MLAVWSTSILVACSGTRLTGSHRETTLQSTSVEICATPVIPVLHGSFSIDPWFDDPLSMSELAAQSSMRYAPDDFPAPGPLKGLIERILVSEGVPGDIGALPWIESEYYIGDYSSAGAAGPWQFMRGTAQFFDLEMTEDVDERYSWVESTRAAARYLRYLYGMFGNWQLAIAAYNCGEGVVQDALRSGGCRFGEIELPGETDAFVPRFAAAVEAYRQVELDTEGLSIVMVPPSLDLRILAVETGIPIDTLVYYNRCYLKEIIPPYREEWELIAPSDRAGLVFETAWSMERSRYLVRYGDTWSDLSASFGVDTQDLMTANVGTELTAGSWLVLPETGRNPVNASASDRPGYFQYTVRSGDTLSEIAATVGVSSSEVAVWNDILPGDRIYPGQVLVLRGAPIEDQEDSTIEILTGGGRITHTVEQGDTLWDLSIRYSVSIEQIMQLNSMEDAMLSIGRVIVIRPE